MVRKDVGRVTAAGFGFIDAGVASQILARGGVQGLEGMSCVYGTSRRGVEPVSQWSTSTGEVGALATVRYCWYQGTITRELHSVVI